MATKTTKKAAKAKKPVKAKRPVRAIPKGYATVTATMNQADASASIGFMKRAFGAKVLTKMAGPGGKIMHAEVAVGDSLVMVSDAMQDPPRQAAMFLYVPSVDKTFAKAIKAGATVLMPVENQFWGDRFGRVMDPHGNIWAIATRVENVPPVEMKKRMKAMARVMAAAGADA